LSYLLDSNAWISLLPGRNPGVLTNLKQRPSGEIVLCSVVLAELWFGAEFSDAARKADNHRLVDELEARYRSFAFDNLAAREYAAIRAELSVAGQPIGPNDTMIAAIARSRKMILITHNTAEFCRVPGLAIEDWQSP
jgi:tRNA(fMet)-specific endonuclease VapC